LSPVETPPSNIVDVSAFDIPNAIIENLALPVNVTVIGSEFSADPATEYHSSMYMGLPVAVTRWWKVK